MQGDHKERWQELCELAVKEQDPDRLAAIVEEIISILGTKESRLRGEHQKIVSQLIDRNRET